MDIAIWCLINFIVSKNGLMECFDNWYFDNWYILTSNVLKLPDFGILMFYIFSITFDKIKNFDKMLEKIYPYQFYSEGFYTEKDFNKFLAINCDRFPKNGDPRLLIIYKFSIIIAKNFEKMFEKIYPHQIHSKEFFSEKDFNGMINKNCNRTFSKNGYKNLNKFDRKIGKNLENKTSKNLYNNFNKNFDILLMKLSINLIAVNFFKANFIVNFSNHTIFLQNILSINNITFYHGS